ncbi:hypothetical protein C7D72_28025 [Klebsiella pneumoniae]|nr:hypothetical protein C7D72_28025 [Klebsiella pneumoniae]
MPPSGTTTGTEPDRPAALRLPGLETARPSGNVSAILRPSAPAVSARKVNKLTAGRTNVGRVRRSHHPA